LALMQVIHKRLLARRDSCQAHPRALQSDEATQLDPGNEGVGVPRMRKSLCFLGYLLGAQERRLRLCHTALLCIAWKANARLRGANVVSVPLQPVDTHPALLRCPGQWYGGCTQNSPHEGGL